MRVSLPGLFVAALAGAITATSTTAGTEAKVPVTGGAVANVTFGGVADETSSRAKEQPVVPEDLDITVNGRTGLPRLQVDATLRFRVTQPSDEVRFQLGRRIELDSVFDAYGVPLVYERDRESVLVRTAELQPGSTSWRFRYWLRLGAPLEQVNGFFTQAPWYPHLTYPAAAGDFPRWIPTTATLRVRLPTRYMAVSAGRRTVVGEPDGNVHIWSQRQLSPLHPLVIGEFRMVEHRADEIVGRGFFAAAHAEQGRSFLEYAVSALEYYAETFGAFGLENYSLVELPLPAELRGMTLPGVTLVSARDVDPASAFPYRILAHELAHTWWNLVVAFPKRSDYWLREGLPTYSALMFLERTYGSKTMRQELERTRRIVIGTEVAQPLSAGFDMDTPELIYAFNYHKSAFVMHMLRGVLGRDDYIAVLRDLLSEHAGDHATAADFRRLAGTHYGEDLGWFFTAWVDRAEVPRFRVRYQVDADDSSGTPRFRVSGSVTQEEASVEGPALLRLHLAGAPPLEYRVWLAPDGALFSIVCPSEPQRLEFDPDGDLLHRGVEIERVSPHR